MKKVTFLLFFPLFLFYYSCGGDDDVVECQTPSFEESCCSNAPLDTTAGTISVYVPNAFTPNADGFNDLLVIFGGPGVSQIISYEIFQNDQLFFSAENIPPNEFSFGWDGQNQDGEAAPAGIYRYNILLESTTNQMSSFTGLVCLRRGFPPSCVNQEADCRYATQHDGQGGLDEALPGFEECE